MKANSVTRSYPLRNAFRSSRTSSTLDCVPVAAAARNTWTKTYHWADPALVPRVNCDVAILNPTVYIPS
jgi:hypothetical protein